MTLRLTVPAIACAALALSACQQPPATQTKPAYIYEADTVGAAPSCTAQDAVLTNGKESTVTMSVQNDGGWCAAKVSNNRAPYDVGVLSARPAHGKVLVHSVGYDTRMDYTPDAGYQGSDTFAVTLFPGESVLRVNVAVTPGRTNIVPAVTGPKTSKSTASSRKSTKRSTKKH